ncbi:hypothetical protein SMMN14_09351 [Sphaerulina musiva]
MSQQPLKSCLKKAPPAPASAPPAPPGPSKSEDSWSSSSSAPSVGFTPIKLVRFAVNQNGCGFPTTAREELCRRHPHYVPGKYADMTGQGFENTSNPFRDPDCEFVPVGEDKPSKARAEPSSSNTAEASSSQTPGAANKDNEENPDADLDALSLKQLEEKTKQLEARLAAFK